MGICGQRTAAAAAASQRGKLPGVVQLLMAEAAAGLVAVPGSSNLEPGTAAEDMTDWVLCMVWLRVVAGVGAAADKPLCLIRDGQVRQISSAADGLLVADSALSWWPSVRSVRGLP